MHVHLQAKPILDDKEYSQLLDSSLQDDNNSDQMEKMALAATLCIRHNPQTRPTMGMVSQFLILHFIASFIILEMATISNKLLTRYVFWKCRS